MTGWPANPKLVWHLKSNLIRTCVHVDEAVMGLSVHTDGDGEGENPLLLTPFDGFGPRHVRRSRRLRPTVDRRALQLTASRSVAAMSPAHL